MLKTLLAFALCLLMGTSAAAQNPLPLGQWRSHLPFPNGKLVTQSRDKVFYATAYSIIEVDKEERALRFLDKVNALSNVGIQLIRYNPLSEVLIVAYRNAVIDLLLPDGETITLPQIRNFTNFVGEKEIYDIFVENDSIIYLAANYGVSQLNILTRRFTFTTFTGVAARRVHVFDGDIYIATDEGIYRAPTTGVNLLDFGNWQLLGSAEGFPGDYSASAFATFKDALYVGVNDTLFRYENNRLEFVHYELGSTLEFLTHEGFHLLAGYRPGRIVFFHPEEDIMGILPGECVQTPVYAIEDAQSRIWIGNERFNSGFRSVSSPYGGSCDNFNINSPYSEAVWDMAVYKNQLWMASGGLDQTLSARFIPDGFASFSNGQWAIYNRDNRPELKGADLNSNDDDVQVFVSVAIHPGNGKVYMGSFIEGVIEVDGEVIRHYIETNSSLQRGQDDPRVRVAGLAFDADHNLWVSNNLVDRPLSVLKPDGTWQSFAPPGCDQNQLFDLVVDGSGYKWVRVGASGAGLLLFDEGRMDDPGDDRCRLFTSNNSNLPSNNVNCLAVGLDGDVWVGTTEGITIFECGASAFEDICQGSRRIVEVDGFGAFLLESENVQAIAVDGANRKWVGTQSGLFVLSPNGSEVVAHFTERNSPLLSDDVRSIAIDQDNGEVFIGTNNGLISYQSDAVGASNFHQSKVLVYPNPVREDYDGPIAIRGLARDANVKITDVSGKLVFETRALGGQAIWDGRDYNGRRVQSGVYLVFSTSSPRFVGFGGKADTAVAKILVIN